VSNGRDLGPWQASRTTGPGTGQALQPGQGIIPDDDREFIAFVRLLPAVF
jgi:hypothetical protein